MKLMASVESRLGEFDLKVELSATGAGITAVVGPNGAGKTTLLRTLAGLIEPVAGTIQINGIAIDRLGPHERDIGFVFQDRFLFPHLSVLDNVAFGLWAKGSSRSRARATTRPLLPRLGLEPLASRRPRELSAGQAQRVALARALIIEPRLLLLDEPFSALDATARPEARRYLVAQLESYQGLVLMVTHDPIEALEMANELIVIEDGRVVQTGSPAEVRANPLSDYVAAFLG